MNLTSNTDRISSSASTGGAGIFFEQHVDAYWLALILVRGIPPILRDCTVNEVRMQTEQLGWHTDDFLVIGKNGSGQLRKLIGQVKQTFTVSAANDECKKADAGFLEEILRILKNSRQNLIGLFSSHFEGLTLYLDTFRGCWTAHVPLVMKLISNIG